MTDEEYETMAQGYHYPEFNTPEHGLLMTKCPFGKIFNLLGLPLVNIQV